MEKISVLGPKDTFSDYAAQKYLNLHPEICAEISYQKTIRKVFEDLSSGNSQISVVPIENINAGFVWMTLDGFCDFSVQITEEFILPIQLSFLSKSEYTKLKNIFVHPLAEGQCADFIYKNFENVKIIYTDSNIDSFQRLKKNDFSAAVVPNHIYEANNKDFPFSVKNICEANNCTRFLVLRKENEKHGNFDKTSVIISDNSDSPGILKNIADAFASREINMTSIISRPTKQMIGKYHFFIDIEGSILDGGVSAALSEIGRNYPVKYLGCYKSVK